MTTIGEAVNQYVTWQERGRGSHKTYKASIGILEAEGESKAEALTSLLKQVVRAMDGGYYPRFLAFRDWQAIVYRDPSAFFIQGPYREGRGSRYSGSGPYSSHEEAEWQARVDLACLALDGLEETSPVILHAQEKPAFRERHRSR
jgi:hypothetical protein